MSEKYRGPRVVPDPEMTALNRHPLIWFLSMLTIGLSLWGVAFLIVWWVVKR